MGYQIMNVLEAFVQWSTATGLSTNWQTISYNDRMGAHRQAFGAKAVRAQNGTSRERDMAWFAYCDARDGLPPGTTYRTKFYTIMGTTYNGLTPPDKKTHQTESKDTASRVVEFKKKGTLQ